MEAIFNELSVQILAENKNEVKQQITNLLRLFKELQGKHQFTKLRLPDSSFYVQELCSNYTLNDWLNDAQVNKIYQELFRSIVVLPHFDDLDEKAQDEYLNFDNYRLDAPETIFHKQECDGLINAYLANTLAVSFSSHELWKNCKLSIVRTLNKKSEILKVNHASSSNCLDEGFSIWLKRRKRSPLNSHSEVDVWFPLKQFSLSKEAKDDLIFFYQNGFHRILEDIEVLLEEIQVMPLVGKGKPEVLKNTGGWMSRRITDVHRLVYKVENDIIVVKSCHGHYDDR